MELWDLYDKNRAPLGRTMVRGNKVEEGTYRLTVHICIFNSKGEMLIQKRQPFKKGWSGMWDVSVGGSATAGDDTTSAAERELFEELGLKWSFAHRRPSLTVHFKEGFDDVYLIKEDVDTSSLRLQPEEVERVDWASLEDICAMIDSGEFIPYKKSYIETLFFLSGSTEVVTRRDTSTPPFGS